jgi:hypothetical protein
VSLCHRRIEAGRDRFVKTLRGVDADPEFLGKLCRPAGISRPRTPAKSTTGSRARATAWVP